MLNPTTTITSTSPVREPVANPLMAVGEERPPVGLLTVPVDVGLLEELQLDELGRRSRWLPGDCLL